MTSTTTPTTLHEYQQFVRAEALKVQADMGWPDEKLNQTLRALGLPEKRTFTVPVLLTAQAHVLVSVTDVESEEAARASVEARNPAELSAVHGGLGGWTARVIDLPPEPVVGGPDFTLSNRTVYSARRLTDPRASQCEVSIRASSGRRWDYCTLPAGHGGALHAVGDGFTITRTWDA